MGGKIPRNIRVKVVRQWLDGLTRERIARTDGIVAGTVTASPPRLHLGVRTSGPEASVLSM